MWVRSDSSNRPLPAPAWRYRRCQMQRAAFLPARRPSPSLSLTEVSGEGLLALVDEGREDALAELYDRYGKLAYALALRVLRDRQFAEDAVQEAFLAVWRTASAFSAERGSARAWILTLVHRRAVDRVRSEQRNVDASDDSAEPELAFESVTSIERVRVRKALMRLAPAQRQMLALAYYEGLTQAQTARALGVPIGTVKSGTARALARLALLLDDAAADAGADDDELGTTSVELRLPSASRGRTT